jgi:hypothetical protein
VQRGSILNLLASLPGLKPRTTGRKPVELSLLHRDIKKPQDFAILRFECFIWKFLHVTFFQTALPQEGELDALVLVRYADVVERSSL